MKIKGCPFCDESLISKKVKFGNGNEIPCDRLIFENESCYAVLKPEQHSHGEALMILKEHVKDITDNIEPELLSKFIISTQRLAHTLKCCLTNELNEKPDKIYTSTLCDGIQHLHFHLIPRYPFTETDRDTFRRIFENRDSEKDIQHALDINELGGYWYVSEREANHKKSEYWQLPDKTKAIILENRAACIRSKIC